MIELPFDHMHPPAATPPIRCWFPQDLSEPRCAAPLDPDVPDPIDAWEAACVRQAQGGQPEAFNPLVAHYAPRIRAYLFRMVRNHEEAEDLTQDVFIKAFQALHRFDADRPFKRWLYTIATNTGLNALRAQKRKGAQVPLIEEQYPAAADPAQNRFPIDERLEAALAALPPRAAQLIALHYHEGFSLAEAGTVLGMSEGAAKAALCRARAELRNTMKGER